MNTINFWPILVATVVSYIIGALWYSPILFGKEWMHLLNMSEKEMIRAKEQGSFGMYWKLYVGQFISALVSFAVLAFIISVTNAHGPGDGALIAFLIWLGFNVTDGVGKVLWEKKPLKLMLIGSIATLVSLVIGGIIIGVWM